MDMRRRIDIRTAATRLPSDLMGILSTSAEFLVQAKKDGVRFDTTVTLGRQSMFVSPVRLARLLKANNLWPADLTDDDFYRAQYSSPYNADALFRHLGAATLHTMDYSAYEGATMVVDLNLPLADKYRRTADLVFDGGTLEHVFNFPAAIKSCMELVKVGGHFMAITPCNNYTGHGFYQFSPELFYRVLSPDNGFKVERMYMCEDEAFGAKLGRRTFAAEYRGPWYAVADPAVVNQRVPHAGSRPVYLFVRARRVEGKPIFEKLPLQSDYQTSWAGEQTSEGFASASAALAPISYTPKWAKLKDLQLHWLPLLTRLNPFFVWRRLRVRSFANRTFYRRERVP